MRYYFINNRIKHGLTVNFNINELLYYYICEGNIENVKYLLYQDNFSQEKNDEIINEHNSFKEHISNLLNNKKENEINEDYFESYFLHAASLNGYLEIVTELMNHPKMKIERNSPLFVAILYKHYEIVEELLKYPTIYPCCYNNENIRLIVHTLDLKMLKILLRDPRINLLDEGYSASSYKEYIEFSENAVILAKNEDILKEITRYFSKKYLLEYLNFIFDLEFLIFE